MRESSTTRILPFVTSPLRCFGSKRLHRLETTTKKPNEQEARSSNDPHGADGPRHHVLALLRFVYRVPARLAWRRFRRPRPLHECRRRQSIDAVAIQPAYTIVDDPS